MITIENYVNVLLCKFRNHSALYVIGVEDFTNQLLIQKPLLCVCVTRPFMYIQNIIYILLNEESLKHLSQLL